MRALTAALAAACLAGCALPSIRLPQGDLALRNLLEGRLPGIEVQELRPGLAYGKLYAEGPVVAHVLAIDLSRPELYLRPVLARDRLEGGPAERETLPSMMRRTRALAGLTGDYSAPGFNVSGLTVIDGKVHFAPRPPRRSALLVGRDRRVAMGRFHPDAEGLDPYQALGGGPVLVSSSAFRWEEGPDGSVNGDFFGAAAAAWRVRRGWTVVGLTGGGRNMLWIVVPGDPPWYSRGMTPSELGAFLATLGCEDAISMEGGPAAAMALGSRLVSLPPGAEGEGPPLGSALALYSYKD